MELNALTIPLKIGNVAGGNYSEFELTGFPARKGSAGAYRDEYVGGEWVPAAAAAAPDAENHTIGGVPLRVYAFDGGTTEERLSNWFEIAHDVALDEVNAGTKKLEWHVHFLPATTGTGAIKWFFDWCYLPPNGTALAQSAVFCIQTIAAPSQYTHFLCGAELPVPVGGYGIGGVIAFNLRRTPSDAADTFTGDALLIKTALHVPVDTAGSRQRYVK